MLINKLLLKLFPSIVGNNFKSKGIIQRRGKGLLIIGNNVVINSSENANIVGETRTKIYVEKGHSLKIGNNVGISNAIIVCKESIEIEDNVLIGANAKIYDSDFHSLDYTKRGIPGEDLPSSKKIVIKKNAFIGAHSIILKGVTIGERSIVGAGSVVTKDIPNDEIWAGNPAKFIRKIGEKNEKN